MRKWINSILEKVKLISPVLVRTHNNFLEGYIALKIKENFKIPYVTSLHGVWDTDDLSTLKSKIHRVFRKKIEVATLKGAAAVICVYSAIIEYAKKHGCQSPHLIHNFVGGNHLKKKISWNVSQPIKLITVNRQLPEKNPENIIKALNILPYAFEYTLVGDGILHNHLKDISKNLAPDKKVKFIKSLPNINVCALYSQSDFMISNCHYKGISKTIIEAGLSGLPIVINRYRDDYELEEYRGGWIKVCEDTPKGYASVLEDLIKNDQQREYLGKNAISFTAKNFSPESLENKIVAIYSSLSLQ